LLDSCCGISRQHIMCDLFTLEGILLS